MHLVIISGATRPKAKSNTAAIIDAFRQGFEDDGSTAEVWYLSDRLQWPGAADAFAANTQLLFALPLYVENIPGSMLEFLEQLTPKTAPGTTISFLLQGGFPEAAQSRCCERFLQTLPRQLGCSYGGTLIRGDMFGLRLLGKRIAEKLLRPIVSAGRAFAAHGGFDEESLRSYSSPETLTPKELKRFQHFGRHMQRLFIPLIARKQGCRTKLIAKVYLDTPE